MTEQEQFTLAAQIAVALTGGTIEEHLAEFEKCRHLTPEENAEIEQALRELEAEFPDVPNLE